MERDFLGLSSKNPSAVVKEEISTDGRGDTGFTTGSRMQWPFSKKVSTLNNLMSLKVAQEDKTETIESDALVSSGFMSILSADACDPGQKRSAAEIQMFPVTDHAISISTGNPFFNNHYPATGQNTVGTTMKLLGGFPVTAPLSILPMAGPVSGVTDSSVKASGSPSQLTIFYAGTVNIFDDISPEKAQAIMFLAGNGSSIPSNSAQPKVQVQAYSSKSAVADVSPVNQPIMSTPPCSSLSSSLHTGSQSRSMSTSNEEIMATKTTGPVTTPVAKPDHPKTGNVVGSVATATMIPSAPQARQASLARFLEKRKERVTNAAPYNPSKKTPDFANPATY
ncbi:hypothetical protein OIU76_011586 [Salix suchowensis]|nr:protein TIFY 6B [Salix suchowensis]KAJ6324311.1 hypothetical protein OIU76_011586 [Salix suchowensis]KAJ6356724.1 hypothetical protein OIU78_004760 [Salix suchowensis]